MSKRRPSFANGVLLFVSLLVALALTVTPALGDDGNSPYPPPGDPYLPLVFKGAGPDTDLDGVLHAQDECPHAPPGFVVNGEGCFQLVMQ